MKPSKGILIFGITEISIGTITLIAILTNLLLSATSTKPLNVLTFVIATSIMSVGLGVGIILRRVHAYHMLLFFASVIILSKILIFTNIISLHGALETSIPASRKNIISLIYHIIILIYFNLKDVRKEFVKG
jgi:hypothetical protein